MATNTFSIKKFIVGFLFGVVTVAVITITSVFLWGDKFLSLINNLYLKF